MNPIAPKTVLESGFKSLSGKFTSGRWKVKKRILIQKRNFGTYQIFSLQNQKLKKKTVRKNPKPEEGVTFSPLEINLSDLPIQEQASLHAIEREEALSRQWTTVAALTAYKLLPPNKILEVVPAEWQVSKGSKEKRTEAAHVNLMVKLGGQPLTYYVSGSFSKTAIQFLYTHTHTVDATINKVDTWLERSFLRRDLQHSLTLTVRELAGRYDPAEIESYLKSSHAVFKREARFKIEDIIEKLESKIRITRREDERISLEIKLEVLLEALGVWKSTKSPESISRPMICNALELFKPSRLDEID